MAFRHISPDIKLRILSLLVDNPFGLSKAELATLFNVSTRSIDQWIKNDETWGNPVPPSQHTHRRPSLLSGDVRAELALLLSEEPSMFLDEIADWLLIFHDCPIAIGSLCDVVNGMALTRKQLRRRATERNEEDRADYIQYMRNTYTSGQLVFGDESSKDERTIHRRYGRATVGHRSVDSQPHIRGDRWSILPVLNEDGYLTIRFVLGSVDAAEFLDFILEDVLPKMNPFPGPNSVLVLDNCAIHKSNAIRNVIEDAGCRLEFLPPYSPDFNPIEESFSCVKHWMRRHWHHCLHGDPIETMSEACAFITGEKAKEWIRHSGYV